jgi:hypothetical protein
LPFLLYFIQPSKDPSGATLSNGSLTRASPEDYLDSLIFARGYSTIRYTALESAYYNEPTPIQEASYSQYIIDLVNQDDVPSLRSLLSCGLSNNPSTYSGETLAHYVCKVGKAHMLKMLIECGCDVRIADGTGATPLHEACRRDKPSFEVVDMLIQCDVRLFHITDSQGLTPLACIPQSMECILVC